MSLSRCKSVLKRAYKSLSKSKHSSGDRSGDESSFLPQVTQKVEALERQCGGGIEIESPSSQHKPILGQTPLTPDPGNSTPIPRTSSFTATPQGDSASLNSRSESLADGAVGGSFERTSLSATHDATGAETAEQGAVGGSLPRTSSQDSFSVVSARMTSKEVAQHLISKEDMSDYFSGLVEHSAAAAVEENLSEGQCDFATSYEETMAQERGENRFTKLCDLPLKLILTPLCVRGPVVSRFASLLEMQFGPLHAALQVGDVILEWNDTSLVVPHFAEHDDQLMKTDVRHLTDWVTFTSGEVPRVREAIRTLDYQKQIELIYRVSAEKQRLIDNLVDVIVTYNRQCYYDLIRRNCQHFVTDALRALGVNKPIEFTGGLGEYYQALKRGRSSALHAKFAGHSHLDRYVREKEENGEMRALTKDDLEYLLAMYFRYHLEQKTELQRDNQEAELSGWSCNIKGCYMAKLEKQIDFESLRIHNFKTYDKPH